METDKVVISIVGDGKDLEEKISRIGLKAETALGKIGDGLTKAGTKLTACITEPAAVAAKFAVKIGTDFEEALSKVQAISGATGEDMEKLRDKAIEMGAKTKFSLTESAEAFQYMAMAGWDTGQMLEGVEGIMTLAEAGGLDFAAASDIVTGALKDFGLSARDSGHFADVLAKASSSANTNVAMLGESFKHIAPVAGKLGYSVEDTAVAFGLMANAGIKASQVGASLGGALGAMIKPSDEAAALMREYDISLANADGTMKGLQEVMLMLRDRFSSMTVEEQAFIAETIFGKEAMFGMMAVINASEEEFAGLAYEISNAEGAAKSMSETQMESLLWQIETLNSSLEILGLQIAEALMPYIQQLTEWLQGLVEWFMNLDEETQRSIIAWIGFAAIVGPLFETIGKIATGIDGMIWLLSHSSDIISLVSRGFSELINFGSILANMFSSVLTGASSMLSGALSFLLSPAGLVVAAIAAIIAIGVLLWKNWDEVKEWAVQIWTGIKDFFLQVWSFLKDLASSIWNGIKDMLIGVWNGVSAWTHEIWNGISTFLTDAWNGIYAFAAGIWNGLKGCISDAWQKVQGVTIDLWNRISGFLSDLWNKLKSLANSIWSSIKDFFANIWSNIVSLTKSAWENIRSFLSGIWDNIVSGVKNAWGGLTGFFSNLWNQIKDTAWNGIQNIANTIWNCFQNIIGGVWDLGKQIVRGLWDGINSGASWLWDKLNGFFGGIINKAKSVLGIHSPSKEFAYLGEMSALGYDEAMGEGMEDAKKHMEKDLNSLLQAAKVKAHAVLNMAAPKAVGGGIVGNTTNYVTNDKGVTQNFYSQTVSPYDAYRRAVLNAY